jgi:hypothetical protein
VGSVQVHKDCPVWTARSATLLRDQSRAQKVGKPCCGIEDYPCDKLDLVTPCDTTFGAGEVFPAGGFASNMPCPIDGGRRYMVKGQTDLHDTFACAAKVGASGGGLIGQALTAAMQKDINDGGCNNGFLRDDALLMVTLIQTGFDIGGGGNISSEGYAEDWAKAVLDAKHGDPESVVMLNFLRDDPSVIRKMSSARWSRCSRTGPRSGRIRPTSAPRSTRRRASSRRRAPSSCRPADGLRADAGDRRVVARSEAPGADLPVLPTATAKRDLEALHVVREEGPQRRELAGRECLDLEPKCLALLLAQRR